MRRTSGTFGTFSRAFSAVCLVGLAGCGHMNVHEAVLRPAEARTARNGRAEVYLASQAPARPFYDVALLQAVGFGNDATMQDVTEALAARGGQLGCDAVVGVTIDQGASLAHAYGVCVRYSPVARPPAPPRPARPAPPPPPDEAPSQGNPPPERPAPPEPDDESEPAEPPEGLPM